MKKEESLHLSICNYLRLQYPKVLFNTDLSGIKLTIGQAVKVKKLRSGRAFPDLQILQPNSIYHGLFLELKSKSPYKKDGQLLKDKHLEEQSYKIFQLNGLGYYAAFVWEFDQTKRIIDEYLSN